LKIAFIFTLHTGNLEKNVKNEIIKGIKKTGILLLQVRFPFQPYKTVIL
jgi:hypothetical protein